MGEKTSEDGSWRVLTWCRLLRLRKWLASCLDRVGRLAERVRPTTTEVVLAEIPPRLRRMRMRSTCSDCPGNPYFDKDGQCDSCRQYDWDHQQGDYDPRYGARKYWVESEDEDAYLVAMGVRARVLDHSRDRRTKEEIR